MRRLYGRNAVKETRDLPCALSVTAVQGTFWLEEDPLPLAVEISQIAA